MPRPPYAKPPTVPRLFKQEFKARLVDGVNREPCAWPCAVAHFGTGEYHRGDFEPVDYRRAHGLLTASYRKLLLRLAGLQTSSLALTDVNGASATYHAVVALANTDSLFNARNFNGNVLLQYGDSATAESAAHTALQGTKRTINASSCTYDNASTPTATVSGSRVHSEADMTVRELGYAGVYSDSAAARRNILLDRSLPTAASILTDQSASMTYVWTL